MRTLLKSGIVLVAAFVLAHGILIGSCRMSASAEERPAGTTVGQAGLPGRELLVAGADTVADGKSPTHVTIDFGTGPVPPTAKLELSLSPVAVTPNETYFVVVSLKTASGEKRLGTVSFFPPRPGAIQAFYFDISTIVAELRTQRTSRVDLSIALTPANRDQDLKGSSVRVVDARLVQS
jgi:hypothetical protein